MSQKSVFKSEEGKQAILAVYGSILQNWPVPYETHEVETRHGRTFVIACGDTALPPLFLLHGSGSNAAMFIGDAVDYSRSFRVYAVDIPGEAGKSSDIRPNVHTGAHAEWLCDVFESLGVKKAAVAGISLGGWLAAQFACAYPERVEKLVLLCPAGIGPQKLSFALSSLRTALAGKRGAEKALRKVFADSDIPEEALAYTRLISQNFTYYRGILPRFSDVQLARLHMPVMLIAGENDALLDMRKAEARAKKIIPNLTAVMLEDAGHVLMGQQGRILSFLNA